MLIYIYIWIPSLYNLIFIVISINIFPCHGNEFSTVTYSFWVFYKIGKINEKIRCTNLVDNYYLCDVSSPTKLTLPFCLKYKYWNKTIKIHALLTLVLGQIYSIFNYPDHNIHFLKNIFEFLTAIFKLISLINYI